MTHYVLATIVQLLDEDKARARIFHLLPGAPGDGNGPAYADFFRVLAKPDWFAQEKALHCLARLVDQRIVKDMGLSAVAAACGGAARIRRRRSHGAAAQTIVQLVQWLCGQLRQPSSSRTRGAVRRDRARDASRRARREAAGDALGRRGAADAAPARRGGPA